MTQLNLLKSIQARDIPAITNLKKRLMGFRRITVFALCLTLAACGMKASKSAELPTTTSDEHTITGTLVLDPDFSDSTLSSFNIGERCAGTNASSSGGYSDIVAGARVSIRDSSDKIIALGVLADGKVAESSPGNKVCQFPIQVDKVPNSDFYSVELGSGRRGKFTLSKQELESKGWKVAMRIGG